MDAVCIYISYLSSFIFHQHGVILQLTSLEFNMATLPRIRQAFLLTHQLSIRSRLLTQRRAFHASPQHRFMDTCCMVVHNTLTSMHSFTGLPWVATIPCLALVVRILFLSPVTIYTHNLSRRRAALKPMLFAWAQGIRIKVHQEHGAKGPKFCQKQVVKEHLRKAAEINKRHGTQLYKGYLSILPFPFIIIVIETLRKMCGVSQSLFVLVASGFLPEDQSITEAIPLEQLIAQDQGKDLIPFEESFGNEGALWFQDLLVPDPLMILPFALSATLFMNISYQTSQMEGISESTWQRRLSRSTKVLALAAGPLTLQFPSVMLLYWISSSLFALGQLVLLKRYLPLKSLPKSFKNRKQQVLIGARPRN